MGLFSFGKNKKNTEENLVSTTASSVPVATIPPTPVSTPPVVEPVPVTPVAVPPPPVAPTSIPTSIPKGPISATPVPVTEIKPVPPEHDETIEIRPMRDMEYKTYTPPPVVEDRPFSFFGDNILGSTANMETVKAPEPITPPQQTVPPQTIPPQPVTVQPVPVQTTVPVQAVPVQPVPQQPGFVKQEKPKGNDVLEKLKHETKEEISKAVASQMPYQVTNPEGKLTKRDPNEVKLINLRTYEDDIKFAVKNQDMTKARMLMAEQKLKDENKEISEEGSIKKPRNKIFLLASFLLIVASIGTGGYFFFISKNNPLSIIRPELQIIKPEFIDVDISTEIVFVGRFRKNITDEMSGVLETPFEAGKVREILLTKEISVDEITKKATISSEEFVKFLETNAPDYFIRSLGKDFMFGVYSKSDTENEPFLLFKIDNFQNAFSGMLDWENQMTKDLSIIFNQFDTSKITLEELENITNIENTLSTTTPETVATGTVATAGTTTERVSTSTVTNTEDADGRKRIQFVDQVILNQDTRVVLDENGSIIFLYSFIDEKNLIIVNNKETLNEILIRMRGAKLIR